MLFFKVLLSIFCVKLVVTEYGKADPVPFISKCCQFGEYIDLDTHSTFPGCRELPNSTSKYSLTTPEFHYNSNITQHKSDFIEESVILNVKFETTGFPNCTYQPKYLTNADDFWFRLKDNNLELGLRRLLTPDHVWIKLPQWTYCLNRHSPQTKSTDELRDFLLILCHSDLHDYNIYLISKYVIGATDLLNLIIVSSILMIYWILRKTHNVVGWLIFCIVVTSELILGLSGTFTIANASWIDVERSTTCVALDTTLQYLYVVLCLTNFLPNLHIFLTFWKMLFRIETVDRNLDKLKIYIPIIIIMPALVLIIDQICVRMYKGFSLVTETHFAYSRCSLPETKFYGHVVTIIVVSTLLLVVGSGLVVLRLRSSSNKLQTSSSQKQFVEMSTLFLKLFVGSSAPILVRALLFSFFHKGRELSWYLTATFCLTMTCNTLCFFFFFGVTKSNISKLKIIMEKNVNLPNSGQIAISSRHTPRNVTNGKSSDC